MIVGTGQLLRDSESLVSAPGRIALGIGTLEVPETEFPGFNAAWVSMMRKLAANLKAAYFAPPAIPTATSASASPRGYCLSTDRYKRFPQDEKRQSKYQPWFLNNYRLKADSSKNIAPSRSRLG